MKANFITLTRTTRFATGTLLLCTGFLAPGADQAPVTDALPLFESYIKVTGQAAAISGDKSAFQTRAKQPANGGAGTSVTYTVAVIGCSV